jgi:hypothetical protein
MTASLYNPNACTTDRSKLCDAVSAARTWGTVRSEASGTLRACATLVCMTDPMPRAVQDVLDHASQSAQRLATDVIEYPAEKRDEVMQRMGGLLTEVARSRLHGGDGA